MNETWFFVWSYINIVVKFLGMKINAWSFSDFSHEVTAVFFFFFFGKKSCFDDFRPKMVQNGPKVRFSRYKKIIVLNILIFYVKLHGHKDLKLAIMIFLGKTWFWSFWTKRGPKWGSSSFMENEWVERFSFFALSYSKM